MKNHLLTLLAIVILMSACNNKSDKKDILPSSILHGEVIDRSSEVILLAKATEDMRQEDKVIRIPIKNGRFKYEFTPTDLEAYQLIFEEEHNDGAWMPIIFFPENGTTMFKLYPMDKFSENEISNNGLNASFNDFNRAIAQKFQKKNTDFFKQNEELGYDNLNSETYNSVISKLNKVTTDEERVLLYDELENLKEAGLDRSQLGKERDAEYAVILNEYFNDRYNYIHNNRTLVSYALLIEDLMYQDCNVIGKERMLSAFNALKQKYPNHSYTKLGYSLLRALNDLNPGGKYVNFTAPDINGDTIEFKDVLKENKIVLLDLWATWCGPCIAKTRLVRPIYEKYKHKGFTILGVAGERRNLDKFHVFMKKEQWPWQQLIELAGENKIWEKYNVMNSGGGMFLIDSSGEILAVDPSVEEVDTILNQRL